MTFSMRSEQNRDCWELQDKLGTTHRMSALLFGKLAMVSRHILHAGAPRYMPPLNPTMP